MVQRVQTLRSSVKNTRPAAGTREPGELFVSFPDLQLGVINASKAAQDLIAVRFFSAATNYVAGDFVIQAGRGYRAKNSIVAGAFNPADWETLSIIGESEPPIAAGTTSQYWRGDKSWQILDKSAVGLSQVDNTADANKPISTAEQTALNLKANLAGPTFTGDPKAPTPTYPDNDTSIATTAFVSTNFAPVIDPFLGGNPQAVTPPTSDNDTSIATTAYVKANLLSYAPIDSPALTGDPKSVTPLPGDNDTSIATTAFVAGAISNRITDAPNDTNAYGRKANAWVDVAEEAPNDGVSYGRKNGSWVASVGGAVVSDTPPPAPLIPGQLWYEADSGNTYLWYADGDSSQWVQVNVQPAPAATPAVVGTAQARNRIVNSAMQVSQQNGSTLGTTDQYYLADQWAGSFVLTGAPNMNRSGPVLPNMSDYFASVAIVTPTPSPTAGQFLHLFQRIEGVRVRDFMYGTTNAKQAVLRFTCFATITGTFTVAVKNGDSTRTYLAPFTITAANTWETKTLVIPGDTTGTWAVDTDAGMVIAFGYAAGTTYQGTAGWQAGNKIQIAGATNLAAAGTNQMLITQVGLYLDPANTGKAPDWVMPDEAEELQACFRYYARMMSSFRVFAHAAGAFYDMTLALPAPMRATPALTFTGGTNSNISSELYVAAGDKNVRVEMAAIGAADAYALGRTVIANARM